MPSQPSPQPSPPERGFHDPACVPVAAILERDWTAIREEARALTPDDWVRYTEDELYEGAWELAPLRGPGHRFPAYARCPATVGALERDGAVLLAAFSRLRAGTYVQPHHGEFPFLLRVHLGLDGVSEDAGLRIQGETRPWQAGRALVFDDTFEHDAWNRAEADRIVLMVDVLRPFSERRSLLGFARDRMGWRRRYSAWFSGLVSGLRDRAGADA